VKGKKALREIRKKKRNKEDLKLETYETWARGYERVASKSDSNTRPDRAQEVATYNEGTGGGLICATADGVQIETLPVNGFSPEGGGQNGGRGTDCRNASRRPSEGPGHSIKTTRRRSRGGKEEVAEREKRSTNQLGPAKARSSVSERNRRLDVAGGEDLKTRRTIGGWYHPKPRLYSERGRILGPRSKSR